MRTNKTAPRAHLARAAALLALAGLLASGCSLGIREGGVAGGTKEATTTTTLPGEQPQNSGQAAPPEAATPEGALLLIMDASGSMKEVDANGKPLIDSAKEALRTVVNDLPDGLHTGLRVFGHRHPNTDKANGCRDTELIAPVQPLNRDALIKAIDGYDAKGFTPIGRSLQEAAKDLPAEGSRTIILVSDGEDTCAPPDPCEIARDLSADGVEVVINTVGFALGDDDAARDQLTCIAEAAGGQFHDVADAGQLANTLQSVSQREVRRFEAAGTKLEGAPIPRDADTGQVGTTYSDTVVHGEDLYYRFEIQPGSTVQAEFVTEGDPDAEFLELFCPNVYLTDRSNNQLAHAPFGGDDADKTQIKATEPATVDAGEVFVYLETDDCRNGDDPHLSFDIELTLSVVG